MGSGDFMRSRFNLGGVARPYEPSAVNFSDAGFDLAALQSMIAAMPSTPAQPVTFDPTVTNPFRPLPFETFGTAPVSDSEADRELAAESERAARVCWAATVQDTLWRAAELTGFERVGGVENVSVAGCRVQRTDGD